MQKINAVLNKNRSESNSQLNRLVAQTDAHLNLQQLWQAITPIAISQSSFASNIKDGLLTVYAYNSGTATKIKLTSTSLLTQLQNFQQEKSPYMHDKVTGIRVKVQVKSEQKQVKPSQRKISNSAAITLRKLALTLGDSPLADQLNHLADNAKR
jgi:hypothetical protein